MRGMLFIFMLPILVFIGFLALAMNGLGLDKLGKPLVAGMGKSVPAIDLPILDSKKTFTNTDIQNKKVLVNFFASWCAPCLTEHEFLTAISEALNIHVIGIVYKDKDTAIKNYLQKNGNPFSQIALDREGRTAIDWGVTGVPETFLISADGIILAHTSGPLTKSVWEKRFVDHLDKDDLR